MSTCPTKVSVADFGGFVFREPFPPYAHPALGVRAAIVYRPLLLGSADWRSDGLLIHTRPAGVLAGVLNLGPR